MNIVEWNAKAEEMFGFTFREARGKDLTVMSFPHADGASCYFRAAKLLREQGNSKSQLQKRIDRKALAVVASFQQRSPSFLSNKD